MARISALVPIVSIFGLAASLRAAAPLDFVPDTADVVIRLKSPRTTTEKVAEFAESIEENTGKLVRGRVGELGRYISNRSLAGVDQSRDWYVAVFADARANPVVLFIIPAMDAAVMQQQLPDNVTSFVRDDWVYYAEQAEAVKSLANNAVRGPGISRAFDEQSRELFEEADAALFVNVGHLTTVYKERILKSQDNVASLLNQIAFTAPQIEGFDLNALVDMYSDLLSGLFQALEDARGLTAGLMIEDEGIDLKSILSFREGTPTAEFLAAQATSSMPRLTALPPNAQLYWGAAGNMAGLWQWTAQTFSMLGTEEGSAKKLDELSRQFDKLEFQSLVGSLKVGGTGPGMMQSVSLTEVSPISSARDVMRDMTEAAADIKTEEFRQETILERDAEEFGDYTADHVIVEQSYNFGPNLPPQLQQQLEQMQQMLYGPEGHLTRHVYLDDVYLQSLGGGRRAVEDVLERMESRESNGLAEYRQGLMDESNLLVLVDVPGLAASNTGAFPGMVGGPAPATPQPPPKAGETSYVGLAAAADRHAIRAELHIPVEQIRGILPFLALMQMMREQQGLR